MGLGQRHAGGTGRSEVVVIRIQALTLSLDEAVRPLSALAAKALGFNIETPVFDGAREIDIQDTLELANDYVNTEWTEFEKKYKTKTTIKRRINKNQKIQQP